MEARRWQVGELVEFSEAGPVRKVLLAVEAARSALICLKAGQELGAHPAPGHAFVHVLSGRVFFRLDDRGEEVGRGAYFYLPPGCVHGVRAARDSVLLVVVALGTGGER